MELPDLSKLYEDFHIPEFKEWQQEIESRLKGNDRKPFASNYNSNTPLSIISEIETGATIDVSNDGTIANKEILYLLSKGIQAIKVQFSIPIDEDVLRRLLSNVILDYIQIFWVVNSAEYKKIIAFTQEEGYNTSKQCFTGSTRFIGVYDYNNNLQLLDDILLNLSLNSDELIYVEANIDTSYIDQISKLRAIRYVVEQRFSNSQYRLIAKYQPAIEFDSDSRKIANTTMAMSAIIGGCSYVFPYDFHVDREEIRIASNCIQILKFESKMEIFGDPLAGSYMVEELTSAYIEKQNID